MRSLDDDVREMVDETIRDEYAYELECAMLAAGFTDARKGTSMAINGQPITPVLAGPMGNHVAAAIYESELTGLPRLAWVDSSVGVSDAALHREYGAVLHDRDFTRILHTHVMSMRMMSDDGHPHSLGRLLAHLYRRLA